jgi:phenylacetate-CoA ligase
MDAYGRLFGGALFPFWEGVVRRRPTLARLRTLEQTQWHSRDALLEAQFRDLRALLRHALEHVPYYAARLREAGVVPEDIRDGRDLLRIPLLTRADAQSSATSRRGAVPPLVEIEKSTSGTLGLPLTFGYEQDSETWRQAVKLRGYGWAGYRPGSRAFFFWGPGAPKGAVTRAKVELDHTIRRERYFDCTPRSDEHLDRAIAEMQRFRPDVLVCFSSGGGALARRVLERGLSWDRLPVLCGAEALVPPDRRAMEEAFGHAVFETYGSREVMLMAAECEEHDGLHIAMENVIVEVVVQEGGTTRHAEPGEVGEVAVTDLHNFAMPFIRYLNGDRAVAGPTTRCGCQRQLLRIASIEGRVTAMLRDASGKPVAGLFVHAILAHVGQAFRGFQAVQKKDGSVTLRLVKSSTFDEEAHAYLLRGFERYLGGVPVTSEFLDDIPPAKSGKRQVILREE